MQNETAISRTSLLGSTGSVTGESLPFEAQLTKLRDAAEALTAVGRLNVPFEDQAFAIDLALHEFATVGEDIDLTELPPSLVKPVRFLLDLNQQKDDKTRDFNKYEIDKRGRAIVEAADRWLRRTSSDVVIASTGAATKYLYASPLRMLRNMFPYEFMVAMLCLFLAAASAFAVGQYIAARTDIPERLIGAAVVIGTVAVIGADVFAIARGSR